MADVDNIPKTSIEILLDCLEENKNTHEQSSPLISMVPGRLRDLSPESFNPMMVSIGPLHRKDKKLQAFEGQKASYVHALFNHCKLPIKETLNACLEKVNDSISEIKDYYVWIEPYSDVEVATIMVMDGCFILEFLLNLASTNDFLVESIFGDLLLVENQIPFFVLKYIFECTILKVDQTISLTDMILPVLDYGNYFEKDLKVDEKKTHDHILGILHSCYGPTDDTSNEDDVLPPNDTSNEDDVLLPTYHSVVELERAGLIFKPNQDLDWPMAMELELSRYACFPWFGVKPTLRMPVLVISDETESCLRNLIAYEQSSSLVGKYVTSYVTAMDTLIDTPEDMERLVASKASINHIGSNEEAANMINKVCKEAAMTDFFYVKEWQEMDRYYNDWWPKRIAWLRREYFSSPWNLIALLAGIILFVLTVLQTIIAIRPF